MLDGILGISFYMMIICIVHTKSKNPHAFCISNTFISSAGQKVAKKANVKENLQVEFFLFENYSHFSSTLLLKIIGHILKKKQVNKWVCFHDIMRLIIVKIDMRMKNRSRRCDKIDLDLDMDISLVYINQKCLSKMMPICIKQHLSNISSSAHEKVKQHWSWVE